MDGVITTAIRAAGYERLRIYCKRHNGKIDDEIMASIRGSLFVVADFTGSRGGVYYEAGFAHGLDLPVILCVVKMMSFTLTYGNTTAFFGEQMRLRMPKRVSKTGFLPRSGKDF